MSRAELMERVSRPLCVAAIYTIVLRALYSVYGALVAGHLRLDEARIRSNSLTDHLMARTDPLYAMLGVWERLDTVWYVHIAQYGYDRPGAIVYYPLYPLLIRMVSWLAHPLLAALLVSTLASFFFFWGLQKLLELDFPRKTAIRAVYVAGLWPAASILFAGYPEPLVLAFSVWSLYFARNGRWGLAGVLGIFTGASKAVGCFIALPLMYLGWRAKTYRAWTACLALLPPLLFAIWTRLAHLGSSSEVYAQYWHTTVSFPLTTLVACIQRLFTGGPDPVFKMNFVALALTAGFAFLKSVRTEYKLYAAAVMLLFLTKNSEQLLYCTTRYVLVAFPAFIGMASVMKRPALIVLSTLFLAVNAGLLFVFFEWGLIM